MRGWRSARLGSVAALSMVGLLMGSGLAQGQAVIHDAYTQTVDEIVTDICPFPVHLTGTVSASVQARKGDDGNYIRVVQHFDNHFTLSANGKVVTERNRYNEFDTDFAGDIPPGAPTRIAITGVSNQSTLPDGKNVLVEAGRTVFDATQDTVLFQVGNLRTSGDVAALCAALS